MQTFALLADISFETDTLENWFNRHQDFRNNVTPAWAYEFP